MACDQLEYCGDCKNYAKCIVLAKEGKLDNCIENLSATDNWVNKTLKF